MNFDPEPDETAYNMAKSPLPCPAWGIVYRAYFDVEMHFLSMATNYQRDVPVLSLWSIIPQ